MDIENILTLIKAVSDSKLENFEYKDEAVKLVLNKAASGKVQAFASETVQTVVQNTVSVPEIEAPAVEVAGNEVKSPLVGTFYAAPAENAEPFVKVGDKVTKGQVIAIVEAMKLMNEIECEYDGEIVDILVENGEMVEYGQPLFIIR